MAMPRILEAISRDGRRARQFFAGMPIIMTGTSISAAGGAKPPGIIDVKPPIASKFVDAA